MDDVSVDNVYSNNIRVQQCHADEARIKRDWADLTKIRSNIQYCTPFSSDSSLRKVFNGVVATDDVNVHQFESVGRKIINKMSGQPAFTFSFKRKDKAQMLGAMSTVKIAPERTIDPALLFQRFRVVSKREDPLLQDIMSYETSLQFCLRPETFFRISLR